MKLSVYSPGSIEEIRRLFTRVFSSAEGESEGLLVGGLAYDALTGTDADDLYGFVAEEAGQIIAAILFTRLTFPAGVNAFLLSPVAVDSACQGKGIGQELIGFGLDRLKQSGVELVFTYGDPGFYSKVGFEQISAEIARAPFQLSLPEGWLGQSLAGDPIEPVSGVSRCVEAFNRPEIW